MKASMTLVAAMISALTLTACSAKTETPPPPAVAGGTFMTDNGGMRHEEVTVSATVEKIDQKERLVTLRASDGTTETIRLGPSVRNLAQVKRGDTVIATYYKSVVFEVMKPGEAKIGISGTQGSGRAHVGEKPGAAGARVVTLVADIVKLDRKSQEAVLKGPEGKTITVAVQTPAVFDKVKVGDRVEITFTEAVGIDVQPAPKKP